MSKIFDEWKNDGTLTHWDAVRALCMELGEVEDDLDALTRTLEKEKENLRNEISYVLSHMDDGEYTIEGFGKIVMTSPSTGVRYAAKDINGIIDYLESIGDQEIADMIKGCQIPTGKAGGLRITREKGERK